MLFLCGIIYKKNEALVLTKEIWCFYTRQAWMQVTEKCGDAYKLICPKMFFTDLIVLASRYHMEVFILFLPKLSVGGKYFRRKHMKKQHWIPWWKDGDSSKKWFLHQLQLNSGMSVTVRNTIIWNLHADCGSLVT